MTSIKLSSSIDLTQFGSIKSGNDILVGMPLEVEYIQDANLDEVEKFSLFFGLNPNNEKDASEIYIDYSIDKKLNTFNEKKDKIREYLNNITLTLKEDIKKAQPDFFIKINELCSLAQNPNEEQLEKSIVKSILKEHAKPLLIVGLAGYGKTSAINSVFELINKSSFDELKERFSLNDEEAKKLKDFKNSTFIPINEGLDYNELLGKILITNDRESNNIKTSYVNGILLSAIKDVYYNKRNSIVVLDEILDNTKLIVALKSSLMANKDGNYNFATSMARNFLYIKTEDKNLTLKIDEKNSLHRSIALFEIGQDDCDGGFICNDEAINIGSDGKMEICFSKIGTPFHRNLVSNSITNENIENAIRQTNGALTKQEFLNSKFTNIKNGVPTLLISEKKANEILSNKNIESKIISQEIPFAVSKENLKVVATGNMTGEEIPVPARDRFQTIYISGISYNELTKNIAIKRQGIDSKLFNKLDEISPDGKAVKEVTEAIINFVRNIAELQESGEMMKPEPDTNKEPTFKPTHLSSIGLNPRLIANIINNSDTPADILENFKANATSILGIDGYPDELEENQLIMLNDKINSILGNTLEKLSKKYKIKSEISNTQEAFIKAMSEIKSFDLEEDKTTKIEMTNTPRKATKIKI